MSGNNASTNKTDKMDNELVIIENKIYEIRGTKVMLDFDLAELYGIENRALKQAVRRNIERFPEDFMFRLLPEEAKQLISTGVSQNVIPPNYNIGASTLFAFTENGVAMLSSVLRSPLAIQININIMRTFTKMRQFILSQKGHETATVQELERIKQQLAEIAEDIESNERDHETLFNAIAEISLKLQLNRANQGRITVKGFRKDSE